MPHIDPALFSSTTRVNWSQISEKPEWTSNISGGGSTPLFIDLSNGSARNLGPADSTAAVSKSYVDALISGAPTLENVDAKIATAKIQSDAYTNAQIAAIGNPAWPDVSEKPAWVDKLEFTTAGDVRVYTNLDLHDGVIKNLSHPTESKEASNKAYVDTAVQTLQTATAEDLQTILDEAKDFATTAVAEIADPEWIDIQNRPHFTDHIAYDETAQSLVTDLALSVTGHRVIEVADPVINTDAANKRYVDTNTSTKAEITYVDDGLATKLAAADLPSAITAAVDTGKAYTDAAVSGIQQPDWAVVQNKPEWTDFITWSIQDNVQLQSNLDMNDQIIVNVSDPTQAKQAANKQYVDNVAQTFLGGAAESLQYLTYDSVGDKLVSSKTLDMGFTRVTNVGAPLNSKDAVTREYAENNFAKISGTNNRLILDDFTGAVSQDCFPVVETGPGAADVAAMTSLSPLTNDAFTLGRADKKWQECHVGTLHADTLALPGGDRLATFQELSDRDALIAQNTASATANATAIGSISTLVDATLATDVSPRILNSEQTLLQNAVSADIVAHTDFQVVQSLNNSTNVMSSALSVLVDDDRLGSAYPNVVIDSVTVKVFVSQWPLDAQAAGDASEYQKLGSEVFTLTKDTNPLYFGLKYDLPITALTTVASDPGSAFVKYDVVMNLRLPAEFSGTAADVATVAHLPPKAVSYTSFLASPV